MAYYLVSAVPRRNLLEDLEARLARDEFMPLQPFGRALTTSLRGAGWQRIDDLPRLFPGLAAS